jgi:Rrf2 family transcriptional regulator, cysteine metabolism repressor
MALKLSTKCRYGTRAIVEIARCYGRNPVKRKDIAESQGISEPYLVNILLALKNDSIIDTIRGAQGGYFLTRPPAEISLFQVVKALEGSVAPVECLEHKGVCDRVAGCAARKVWKELMEAQEKVLRSVTLQQLLDKEKTDSPDFCI